jgi:uridine kinase
MSEYYQKQIQEVLNIIHKLHKTKILIGVDGLGGCGKSTFTKELIKIMNNTEIVHMDDFYKSENMRKEINSDHETGFFFDWRKLESKVLIPFTNDLEIRFQRYDWPSDSLKDWQNISIKSNVIVEGVYSTRKELSKYYDLKIWIDCPPEVRLARGIERDGIEMKEYWQNVWMKQENEYLEKHKSFLEADLVISSINTQ